MKSPEQSIGRENQPTPHDLVRNHQLEIKQAIQIRFAINNPETIKLLLEEKNGVYLSQEDPTALCCLAYSQENGFLYLVTSKIDSSGTSLHNFRCDIVS